MKQLLKLACEIVAMIVALPLAGAYLSGALVLGKNRAFPGASQCASLVPGVTGVFLRRAFYRLVLSECGTDAYIGFGTIFSHAGARIGPRAYLGSYCVIGDVTLEADVLLGSNVSIINGNRQHGFDRTDLPIREQPGEYPRVTIGEDSWIGDRAVVMFDVGKHCVVGAAAVVTRAVEDFAIVAGNPARVLDWRTKPNTADIMVVGAHVGVGSTS